jgi:hypothetical protein
VFGSVWDEAQVEIDKMLFILKPPENGVRKVISLTWMNKRQNRLNRNDFYVTFTTAAPRSGWA